MDTLSDILRQTIQDSGLSVRRLYMLTGINRRCIARFLEGYQLTSDNMDALALHFGLTLTPAETVTKRDKRQQKRD